MPIPISDSFRNLWTRRMTTVLTDSGMAMVVFAFGPTGQAASPMGGGLGFDRLQT